MTDKLKTMNLPSKHINNPFIDNIGDLLSNPVIMIYNWSYSLRFYEVCSLINNYNAGQLAILGYHFTDYWNNLFYHNFLNANLSREKLLYLASIMYIISLKTYNIEVIAEKCKLSLDSLYDLISENKPFGSNINFSLDDCNYKELYYG